MLTILFDGVAYGMLLFVLACGLAVTLGLMNFVNLAHGAFAMAGGYLTVILMNSYGVSFFLCLPAAFLVAALLGAILERTLYRHLYDRSHLDQVLFSVGLIFIAISAIDFFMGARQQIVTLPEILRGRVEIFGVPIGVSRLFIIGMCALIMVALQYVLAYTRFGSRLRAAVDDGRVARGLGINVGAVFAVSWALAGALAAVAGSLVDNGGSGISANTWVIALKALPAIIIGGLDSLGGAVIGGLAVGVVEALVGSYQSDLFPWLGSNFSVVSPYVLLLIVLMVRPYGLFGTPEVERV